MAIWKHLTCRWLLCGAMICLAASLIWARPGVVRTKDGRSIEGDITDRGPAGVTIVAKGGEISLARDDVAEITYSTDINELYRQRLAALPADAGAKAHVDLARWLYDNRAYPLALKELDAAQKIDPNNAEADALRRLVNRTIEWDRARQPGAGTQRPSETRPTAADAKGLIGADQINAIRQHELRRTDVGVRIRFERDLPRRFAESANIDIRDFTRLSDFEKLMLIFDRGERDMRKDVRIMSDPGAIQEFRRFVQPILLNGCAASNCHGGSAGGEFILHNPATSDIATYTNFYTLMMYPPPTDQSRRDDARENRMIEGKGVNRTFPEKSLILEFGLPVDQSELDHPQVRGWTPLFRNQRDARYRQIFEWIRGLVPSEPNYSIDFPKDEAADAPPPRGAGLAR